MEDNREISSNEVYRALTNTILNDFNQYKNGRIEDAGLNEKMLVNVFSMIKILEQKDIINNEDTFDEYVPGYNLNNKPNGNNNAMNNGHKIDNSNNNTQYEESFMQKQYDIEPSFIDLDLDNDIPFTENESRIININHDNVQMSVMANSILGDAQFSFNNNNDMFSFASPFTIEQNNNKPILISKKTTIEEGINEKRVITNNKPVVAFLSRKIEGNISFNSDHISHQISSVSNALLSTLDISDVKLVNKSTNYFMHCLPFTKKALTTLNSHNNAIVLNDKIKEYYMINMNEDYLIYMNNLFNKMKEESKSIIPIWNDTKQFFFINAFKAFILSIGISYKNFYEDCLRHLIYQKENFTLEHFLNCFHQLLQYVQKNGIMKFKCMYCDIILLLLFLFIY